MQSVFAAEIKATVDRNPVNLNESFQILFTATESPDDAPDFSPLEKDFELLNQSKSSNMSWVNGSSSRTIQWTLNMMAKQTGSLIIPAISFGDDKSRATTILVTNNSHQSQNQDDELFMEVEVSHHNVYVQSQVLYTLRLYHRVQLAGASLNEPELADAVIEKLGEDKRYNTERNNVAYSVVERKYAIFPQKSGNFTINPLQLTAQVISNRQPRFNGFFNRQTTKTKRISSEAITLQVKAAPNSFTGKHWIPAEQLVIKEEWSGDTRNMKAGEPLTRTLTILAKGSSVAQLPEINTANTIKQLKTYPDQPVLKEQKNQDGIIAFREEKVAYITSKAGRFTLPAVEIPWFNTQTETMEIARIPEKSIVSIASASSQIAPIVTETPAPINTLELVSNEQPENNAFWMWLSLLLASGWIITIILFLKKAKPEQPPVKDTKTIKVKQTIKALKQACTENDPLAAKEALLVWGQIKLGCHNLSEIAAQSEARLRDEIHLLNQILYAQHAEQWQGKKLFQFFIENSAREKVSNKQDDSLEPLFF